MSGGQDLICMGAAHIRAEIAVFLADIDAFNEAYAAMCAAAEMRRENAPLCEKILDLCRAGLNLHIGNNSETPEWILQGETNGIPDNCRNWATFLRVSHSSLNPDLHGAADLAKMSLAEMDGRYVLFRSLIMLLASALFSGLQQGGHAGEMLSAAGEMLNPDDLYQFYGPFYYAMPQGIDEYISTLPSKAAKAIHKARRQYLKGRVVIHDAVFQQRRPDGLTRRERETAELAAKGMRNKEIAAELGISTETVRTHLAKVHQKLLIDRRALIAEKLRMGRS
jgi:DNA-binding CsgD family transcriptional regulator